MILLRRALRSIKKNIKSYAAIFLISLLSVMLYSGLSANYHFLKDNVGGMVADSNIADLYVTLKGDTSGDREELLKYKYGVDDIEERLYIDAYIKERKVYLASYRDYQNMSVPSSIVSGKGGVLITKSFARRRKIDVGDEIKVTVKSSLNQLLSNMSNSTINSIKATKKADKDDLFEKDEFSISLTITGIMQHAEAMGNLASDVGMLYVSEALIRDAIYSEFLDVYNLSLLGYSKYLMHFYINRINISNQFMIKGGNIKEIKDYFVSKENTNLLLITSKYQLPGLYSAKREVGQAKRLCYIFPIVFYISACLIIIASIDKTISDDHMALGLMNALGMGRRRIISYYSILNLFNVIFGAIIGVILGPLIIPKVLGIKYRSMYMLDSYRHYYIYPSYIIVLVVLIFFCVLVTTIKCMSYLKKSPKDAMKNNNGHAHSDSILSRILPSKAFSLKMALRNITFNKTKSLLVIIGIIGCTSLLVCGYGIEDTLDYGLKLEIGEKLDYDIEVSYDHNVLNGNNIRNMDERISYVEEYAYSLVTLEYNDAMVDSSMYVISDDSKCINIKTNNAGATLSEKLAKSLHCKEGDVIGIYTSGKIYNVRVSVITSMFFSQGIYIPKSVASMPYENNRCMVMCTDSDDIKDVSSVIKENDNINYTRTKEQRYNRADSYLSSLRAITGLIKVFAIMLCITVIYNLVSMNFNERIRDMASLKSLGYGYLENAKALTYEISILTIIGGIIGLMLGKPFLVKVLGLNEPPMISFSYRIGASSYFVALFLTIGLCEILNLLISIKIKDVDMVSNLKEKE